MKNALALLRAVTALPASILPPDELRFALESDAPFNLAHLADNVRRLFPDSAFSLDIFDDPALAHFAILRFRGIERTLPQRQLYAASYELCATLELVSAEPDIGSDFYFEPTSPTDRIHEAARVADALCWINAPPPPDHAWALHTARITGAWAHSKGAGIIVAQPDTGIAAHSELGPGMFRLDLARDILTGGRDPVDPMRKGAANPGHGSATASVLASRGTGRLTGAAPAASIVPIRCLEDVKIFDASPVTQAILHARNIGAHVISMSLGGVPSRAMHEAIRAAVSADMIVVAAAGNCVRTVVWPARYDEVVAVAGSNIDDRPWKGTSRGDAVDITAPAELVWRAARTSASDPIDKIGAGQGTSFATALVAGAAALWLAAHGRDAVIAEARHRGLPVQRLFRAALRQTARKPEDWQSADFGPGILDAQALVELPLDAIRTIARETARQPNSIKAFLVEETGSDLPAGEFDWPRYGSELAAIALTQAKLGMRIETISAEAKWAGTQPTAELAEAVARAGGGALRRFGAREGGISIIRPLGHRPPGETGPVAPPTLLGTARRQILESGGGATFPIDARKAIDDLEAVMRGGGEQRETDRRILEGAVRAIDDLAAGKMPSTPVTRVALEALVRLKGRPALRIRDNRIDLADPRAADWHDRLLIAFSNGVIEDHFKRVGRIDADENHVGTGFVVGDGLVLTNRHVLQTFAAPVPRRNGPDRWVLTSETITIDFADRPSSQTADSRFRITGVVGAGPRDIDFDQVDFACLDAALLSVETVNEKQKPLPKPGNLVGALDVADRRRSLLVVGYPGKLTSMPVAETGEYDEELLARITELFSADYGTKYAAPGEVFAAPGSQPGDDARHIFLHDATTLAGNSGSAIIGLDAPQDFIGLHFGGLWRRENYAHALPALRSWSPLSDPSIRWCFPR